MRKVSGSLTFLALLIVFITLGNEPLFAEKESVVPDKSFKELKLEMLELDLSSFGRRLSPYQSCLIHYWREEYFTLVTLNPRESWGYRLAFGVADRLLLDAWKGRFEGSELVLWVAGASSLGF